MADYINFLFFNVELFPLYEVIVWLLLFILIYVFFCAFRKFCFKRLKNSRFCSTARQFAYQRSSDDPASTEATTPPFGEPVVYQNPLNVQPSNSSATTASTAESSRVPAAEPVSSWCASCSKSAHPRERVRRLARHLIFAGVSYLLCVVAFIIFALSIQTQIVIDPHPCIGTGNETAAYLSRENRFTSGDSLSLHEPDARHYFARTFALSQEFDEAWYCNYTFEVPHETVWLEGKGGAKIHGWWLNATRDAEDGKTILIAHGRSLPIPVYKNLLLQLVDRGHDVFIFDYRDFGKSTGIPTEMNMNEDAELALNYVANRQNISKREVVPLGVSLGGSIATNLAVKHNSTALGLISSVDSIREEIKANLKITAWAVASALNYKFDTYNALSRYEGCLFFYVGGLDEIIPAWRGLRLFNIANKKTSNCSRLAKDPKARHCGMPGTPLDNPTMDKIFREWTDSYD